jgi:hypothetical protein
MSDPNAGLPPRYLRTPEAARFLSLSPWDVDDLPALDEKAVGQLRHIRNLANQDNNDWTNMQLGPGDLGMNRRYTVAFMAYNMAVAHYHWLPAAPGYFKKTYDATIQKMLARDVWSYWSDMSRASTRFDPDMTELRPDDWEPVRKENIMYSGHLNAIAALYSYLFQDDKYDKPDSIVFRSANYVPMGEDAAGAPGLRPTEAQKKINETQYTQYNLQALNDLIYWQSAENGFLGVACEPNLLFIVCNQFPMLGFRFQDLRKGTKVADDLAKSYIAAHKRAGTLYMPMENYFARITRQKQGGILGPGSAWTYTFMHMVHPELTQAAYQAAKPHVAQTNADGTVTAYPVQQWAAVGAAMAKGEQPPKPRAEVDGFSQGCTAVAFAEMGDERLSGLLDHADKYLSPRWENGGYFYPRNIKQYDDAGNPIAVGSAITQYYAFGRLCPTSGMKTLYENGWTKEHFAQPKLTAVSDAMDLTRATFLTDRNSLVLSMQPYRGSGARDAELTIGNAARNGDWTLYKDGQVAATGSGTTVKSSTLPKLEFRGESLFIAAPVAPASDFVLHWA